MAETAKEDIYAEARRVYPDECCGALLGGDGADGRYIDAAIPIVNTFEDGEKYHRFMITAGDVMRAEREAARRGTAVLGFWHSHPDHPAVPSEYDRAYALPFYSYVILSVNGGAAGELCSWRLRADRSVFDKEEVQ